MVNKTCMYYIQIPQLHLFNTCLTKNVTRYVILQMGLISFSFYQFNLNG